MRDFPKDSGPCAGLPKSTFSPEITLYSDVDATWLFAIISSHSDVSVVIYLCNSGGEKIRIHWSATMLLNLRRALR